MGRLTEKYNDAEKGIVYDLAPNNFSDDLSTHNAQCELAINRVVDKLGQLEDIEAKLNFWGLEKKQRSLANFLKLILAEDNGFYYKKDNKIYFCRWCVRVNSQLVEVKPCCAVKETTLQSCCYGDTEQIKAVEDAHYWSWKTCLNVHLSDYGKVWALTKEELL